MNPRKTKKNHSSHRAKKARRRRRRIIMFLLPPDGFDERIIVVIRAMVFIFMNISDFERCCLSIVCSRVGGFIKVPLGPVLKNYTKRKQNEKNKINKIIKHAEYVQYECMCIYIEYLYNNINIDIDFKYLNIAENVLCRAQHTHRTHSFVVQFAWDKISVARYKI